MTHSARAEVDVRTALSASSGMQGPLFRGPKLSAVVEHGAATLGQSAALIPLNPGFSAFRGSERELLALARQHAGLHLAWSPPRQLLLDRVIRSTRAEELREHLPRANGQGSGQGVVIGIVDTGLDLAHPDLQNADGTTRVAWLLDLSRVPSGDQADLEETYGCSAEPGLECQILSGEDINRRLRDFADLPDDKIGHGTHVASLAAGNGGHLAVPRYVGMAPEAALVVARVTRKSVAIDDADILLAVKFIFERAEALGMPAVVNLSLGSDFGPHDGTSTLGRALAGYVGGPGRAIVVAAGNSGGLVADVAGYPGPLGVHADVFVPRGESIRVPLLTPRPVSGASETRATLYIWLGFAAQSKISVGLDRRTRRWVTPIAPGHSTVVKDGELTATLINNDQQPGSPLSRDTNGAVVVIDGVWNAGEVFVIRLEGEGAAGLWVQSEGDLSPLSGSIGAVFPRATAEQTINIPAVDPDLIAVGATLNRATWPARAGGVSRLSLGDEALFPTGSLAFFSSSGPSATGAIKPDVVAPGGFVVGAMSRSADPERSLFSVFSDYSSCGSVDCPIVDDGHAVTAGTSMAAPIVSGAIALLLEKRPGLTQAELKHYLQAGARRLGDENVRGALREDGIEADDSWAFSDPHQGAGAIDVVASAGALDKLAAGEVTEPVAAYTEIVLASSWITPDPEASFAGLVKLRDARGQAAVNFDDAKLELGVSGAEVAETLHELVPGLWRFRLRGIAGTGGNVARVKVSFAGRELGERRFSVAVDTSTSRQGYEAHGGCSFVSEPTTLRAGFRHDVAKGGALGLLLAALGLRRGRRCLAPASR